jgi:putative hydroxymethylpyrimidine transport system substrate-binding protein
VKPVRLVVLLLAALTLAACGERTEDLTSRPGPEKFRLILDYFPNADHAGIYAAKASGAFERANLDVEIVAPSDPAAPLKLLQAGKADLVVSYEPELLLARDKGAPLVSVAALVQKPLTSLMSMPDAGIGKASDLEGKTVGTAGLPYQAAYLRGMLQHAGVDPASVKQVDVGFELSRAMLSGRVDATLGAFWNYEGIDLQQRGKNPRILKMDQLGVPTYAELVLVARKQDLSAERAPKLRRFLKALSDGHAALRKDPAAAVDALLEANPDLERKLQTAVVEATMPVFFPTQADKPWGWQDETEWIRYGRWMLDQKLLRRDPVADSALTNEFLPGEGLQKQRTEY